jgi:hypothetical protein
MLGNLFNGHAPTLKNYIHRDATCRNISNCLSRDFRNSHRPCLFRSASCLRVGKILSIGTWWSRFSGQLQGGWRVLGFARRHMRSLVHVGKM